MTGRRALTYVFSAGLGVALFAVSVGDAFAARKKRHPGCRYITVESKYTADTVSGCVRQGRRGPEVRLPSGAWIPCSFGCADTLRSQTIDFWFWIEENALDR
ncbi:MAG: hypothetical protein ACR2PO_08185 [Methyloligellaceae bacterium]